MSGHTPGPWKVAGSDPKGNARIEDDTGRCVAVVPGVAGDRLTQARNAYLVAAAPKMLEAIAGLFEALIDPHMAAEEFGPRVQAALEAVSEAEGRLPVAEADPVAFTPCGSCLACLTSGGAACERPSRGTP